MAIQKKSISTNGSARYLVLAMLVAGAFFGAYSFAQAQNGQQLATTSSTALAGPNTVSDGSAGGAAGGASCACCGSSAPTEDGLTGERSEGKAAVSGDVQTIDVDVSKGYYEPNAIILKAGAPAEITFGQSGGCTGQVMSKDLNFFEDLTSGPKTVKLPALEAGEYEFACGMEMVFGKIIVQ